MRYFRNKFTGQVVELAEVKFYPAGGGFQFIATGSEFTENFEPYEYPQAMRHSRVGFDAGPSYPCLLSEKRWNGWRMPYFTLDVALQVMVASSECAGWVITWEPERDAFVLVTEAYPDEEEIWTGTETDGIKYYDLGAGSWCWDEFTEEDEAHG